MKHALEYLDAIIGNARPALFLDFDGTLAAIAPRPDLAVVSISVRGALAELSGRGIPVAIVSGRDLEDLRRRIDLPGVGYAGSHGFDLLGPEPECIRYEPAEAYLPALDEVEGLLRAHVASMPGVFVERKRYAFAVHYRQVEPPLIPTVLSTVRSTVAGHAGIQVREGKMVLEMVPDLPWDKGRAVLWLLERTRTDGNPIYVGDDITDEDAFRALQGRGVGIIVQETEAPTAASYRMSDPTEVERFLWLLVERLNRRQ